MKKKLYKIYMQILIAVFALSFQNLSASEARTYIEKDLNQDVRNSELTLQVSLDELYTENGNIIFDIGGEPCLVHSLHRIGNQWLATIENHLSQQQTCARWHPLCKNCHQCHTDGCYYYVRHCNLW